MMKYILSYLVIAGGLLLLAPGCAKTNHFDLTDGTPDDGAPNPSVTVDTNVKFIDVSKYAQARVFPGLVCADEPRLTNYSLTMNLDYHYVGLTLRMSVPPQPQFSTGLYAAPGELTIIDVPQGDYSLSVQIGAWTDNLSAVQNPQRDPIIYSRQQLAPGRNYIRNLYGGPVYIYAGKPLQTPLTLTFSNVVKSPDFVLGQTTNADWQNAIRKSCVPYIELRSANMIFVVPRQYCIDKSINDPGALMTAWDQIVEQDYYAWEGLEVNAADPIDESPKLPWRVVQDIRPVIGYGHSGWPVVTYNDLGWFNEFTDIERVVRGWSWGTLHEIGHNNQQGQFWSWSSLGETSNNLFAFKAAHRAEATHADAWLPDHPALPDRIPQALAFAASDGTKDFDGIDARINDPFSRLTPFLQIFDKIPANWGYPGQPDGWGFMTELYKRTRRASRISLNDQDKRDFVYEAICDYTRKDWQLFFAVWGIKVSTVSVNKKAALYPQTTQEIWKYNPITRTGGDSFYDPYNRSAWSITPSSEETRDEGASPHGRAIAALDGDINTFWHTSYSTTMANPPHVLTVDMKKALAVKGFSFIQRSNLARAIKNVKIEVSTNGTSWTMIPNTNPAISAYTYTLALVNGQQDFLLPANQTFRYFRITVPSTADVYDGTNFAALAELNVIKP